MNRSTRIIAGLAALAATATFGITTPADAAKASEKAEARYHATYGPSKAWQTASKAERRHVRHAFSAVGWEETCDADIKHSYMDRSRRKDKDRIVKGLPIVQVKHAGKWYRFAEYNDGICGE